MHAVSGAERNAGHRFGFASGDETDLEALRDGGEKHCASINAKLLPIQLRGPPPNGK